MMIIEVDMVNFCELNENLDRDLKNYDKFDFEKASTI